MKRETVIVFFLISMLSAFSTAQKMSLKGEWSLFIDLKNECGLSLDKIRFNDKILLPASLDEAGKGIKSIPSTNTSRLLRKYTFYGKAWYQREVFIPVGWKSKTVFFNMERTRVSHVWVDGALAGSDSLISARQQYDLTPLLKPGKHLLTVCVDNGAGCGLPPEVGSSHMWTDETQTNWNGILGEISLETKNEVFISSVKTTPNIDDNTVELLLNIENRGKTEQKSTIQISCPQQTTLSVPGVLKKGMATYRVVYPLGKGTTHWSEYSPTLYQLAVQVAKGQAIWDSCSCSVGMSKFNVKGKFFTINGQKTFLRGKHDACVFPLTGYAPMQKQQWINYFDLLKRYGFNHVRFHSWCPPEAAFEAADQLGFYLQPELPFWGKIEADLHTPLNRFLLREGKAMLERYANHPSFVMFSNGNELSGDVKSMRQITDSLRKLDNRPLYTFGTNYHLGWMGSSEGEDYLIACRVGGKNDDAFEPHVRGSFSFADAKSGGILNALYPGTLKNLQQGVEMTDIPVVSHETGQFEMYPDPKEISSYTGVLVPQNLEIFIQRVQSKAGSEKYRKYFDASAALSLLCYKADLELMRRTEKLAGFEMLDLQDYPGQGTAVVGILNALMESKGIITEHEFKQWNNDLMPLWEAGTYTWYNDTVFSGTLKISNHSPRSITGQKIKWTLQDDAGKVLKNGVIVANIQAADLTTAGEIDVDLSGVIEAIRANFVVELDGTDIANSWPVWIYPRVVPGPKAEKVNYQLFEKCDERLLAFLDAGGNAILMPAEDSYPQQTVGGLFTTDYWNYSMFKTISENAKKPVSPGTMGLLIENKHPMFAGFPTETHSNWQWWPVVRKSNPVILDDFRELIHPIVETIDNVERAHFLGLIFECQVRNGKLLVCMSDLKNNLQYKENAQLMNALTRYVGSARFQPRDKLTTEQLKAIFQTKASGMKIEGVKNVSYN